MAITLSLNGAGSAFEDYVRTVMVGKSVADPINTANLVYKECLEQIHDIMTPDQQMFLVSLTTKPDWDRFVSCNEWCQADTYNDFKDAFTGFAMDVYLTYQFAGVFQEGYDPVLLGQTRDIIAFVVE